MRALGPELPVPVRRRRHAAARGVRGCAAPPPLGKAEKQQQCWWCTGSGAVVKVAGSRQVVCRRCSGGVGWVRSSVAGSTLTVSRERDPQLR